MRSHRKYKKSKVEKMLKNSQQTVLFVGLKYENTSLKKNYE